MKSLNKKTLKNPTDEIAILKQFLKNAYDVMADSAKECSYWRKQYYDLQKLFLEYTDKKEY